MAVEAVSLIAPIGEITSDLFPQDDDHELIERLDAYLLEAAGKSPGVSDDGLKAWAYYRAYRSVFVMLSNTPASELEDQGLLRYSDKQIENFNILAQENLALWNDITQTTDSGSRIFGPSGYVENQYKW